MARKSPKLKMPRGKDVKNKPTKLKRRKKTTT